MNIQLINIIYNYFTVLNIMKIKLNIRFLKILYYSKMNIRYFLFRNCIIVRSNKNL